MNNKNYLIFAAAIALASCSVDEYMGENPEFTQTTKENIIGFGGGTGSMSRATSNTGSTNEMLDNQFKVYGWKTESNGTTTQKVFDNYWVWYEGTNKTQSNPDGDWEYVGENGGLYGLSSIHLTQDQYIKYWDYSAENYKFVAGSPINNIEFEHPTEGTDNTTIASATVKGLGGHINPNPIGGTDPTIKPDPVYIAEPKVIAKNEYKGAVNLKFNRLQTKVRVGIYETIPGYKIKSIVFYKHGENAAETADEKKNNVTLFSATSNYFQGGSDVHATVNYKWDDTPNPTYTVVYQNGTSGSLKTGKDWYGGKFNNGVPAITSNPTGGTNDIENLYGTDNDMFSESGYFIVLPTPTETEASALTLKCDYVLESLDTYKETIKVTGATAAIPAAYCKWEPNKMYTYIFKISQETNGTTGRPGNDEPGLFPITFDATAIAEEGQKEGYETIINSPSITTYQAGSVTETGIEYKTGEEIVITVTDDNGQLQNLNNLISPISQGHIAVYYLGATVADAKTEADLTVTAPSTTSGHIEKEVILGQLNDSGANTKATFTPETAGYYAIQYCYEVKNTTPVYKYKVIKVENQSSGN